VTIHPYSRSLLTAAAILSASSFVAAQPQPNQLSPADLVKQVIYNELHLTAGSTLRWRYRSQKQVDGKQESRAVVETKSGSLDRLLMVSGRPLTRQQENAEAERILRLAHSPEEQRKIEQARQKEAQQSTTFLQDIPNAFVFEYAGQKENAIRLTFRPSLQFRPSSREDKVLHQMAGEIWVDGRQKRLISISGQLMDDVKFGGGLLGHLEKGGQFKVQRGEIAPGDWEVTELVVNMRGKALMLKSISVQQTETHSDFASVPDELTIADAAKLLLQQTFVASSQRPH